MERCVKFDSLLVTEYLMCNCMFTACSLHVHYVHLEKWTLKFILYLLNQISCFIHCVNTHIQILKVWLRSVLPLPKCRNFSMGLFFIGTPCISWIWAVPTWHPWTIWIICRLNLPLHKSVFQITILNGKVCGSIIAIKPFELRNGFDIIGIKWLIDWKVKACCRASAFNFVAVMLDGITIKYWIYKAQIWGFLPSVAVWCTNQGEILYRSTW